MFYEREVFGGRHPLNFMLDYIKRDKLKDQVTSYAKSKVLLQWYMFPLEFKQKDKAFGELG